MLELTVKGAVKRGDALIVGKITIAEVLTSLYVLNLSKPKPTQLLQ